MTPLILVVDDEANIRKILRLMLSAEGYDVRLASSVSEAKQVMQSEAIQLVLTDLKLEREDGRSLLKWVKEKHPFLPVVILTAHGTVDSAVDAMKQGAFDYLAKPFERGDLARVIKKAVLTYELGRHHAIRSWEGSPSGFPMVGGGVRLKQVFHLVDKVAATDTTVLITGESGTGKELVAAAIHERGNRAKGPLIKVNCAAIPNTLMESEMFGYERGAFTGAVTSKPGRFELADGGTLFLDEIAEMSTETQVKLLRVLQDQAFERVGGLRTLKVNVRLVAATNKDLSEEVASGRFRADLFYRLNVLPIHLPPLRERQEDIPLLVGHFTKKFSERLSKPAPQINPEALELLTQFPWPGNIRQLENVIERLVVMNESGVITPDLLPEDILEFEEQRYLSGKKSTLKEQVKEVTRQIERKAIEEALEQTAQNVTHAARKLNLSRKGLQLKIKELGLR